MKNKKLKSIHFRPSQIVAIILVILVGTLVVLYHYTNRKAVSGPIETISAPSNQPAKTATPNDTTQQDPAKSSTGGQSASSSKLIAPYGSFVSNHKPGQNGSDLKELSQCSTTPGAKCYIKLTQDNITKTLPEKTADADGSIFWEWNVNDAGLTSGKWTVTAVASLDNLTKTTTDQFSLEVQ